jgi:hypothetical protein
MHEISMELLGSRSQKAERKREEQNQNTEWPVGGYAYVAKQKRFAAGGAGKEHLHLSRANLRKCLRHHL